MNILNKTSRLAPLLALLVMTAFIACDDQNSEIPDTGYVAPDPPSTVVEGNLFTIDFFSRLNDETLFQSNDYTELVSYILSNNSSLAFFFNRSDATIGEPDPVVNVAWKTKLNPFFVPGGSGDGTIEGTGLIFRSLITAYEGVNHNDSLYLAGCSVTAPCNQPVVLTLISCDLTEQYQFPMLVLSVGDSLKTNKIVIGSIPTDSQDAFGEYLRYHLKGFRLYFFQPETSDSTETFYILSPTHFVCRGVDAQTKGELPLYPCKIEYLISSES
jgi:hypothetical protein